MDSSNNKVVDILNSDNWSDALLIKDERGNLRPLKAKKDEKNGVLLSKKDLFVSEGSLAPKDDNFIPIQNIGGNSQDKSELIFHPDDKEEADFIAQNMQQDNSKKYSVEKIVDRIIDKQKLDFDSKNKKIFTNILYNFFRNRKSAVITRELLTNSVLIKNKKLSLKIVDIIVSVIKSINNKIDAAGGLVVNDVELKAEVKKDNLKKVEHDVLDKIDKKDVLSDVSTETSVKVETSVKDETGSISAQDEIKNALGELSTIKPNLKVPVKEKTSKAPVVKEVKPEPVLKKQEKSKSAKGFSIPLTSENISTKKPEIKFKPAEGLEQSREKTSLPKVLRPNIKQEPKKAISDVVTPVKPETTPIMPKSVLTGPVQELQSFDLVVWRRLGNTANERTQKILDKINLLQEESYTKKAQGITAWRDSKVYKLYLQLGAESMIAGKEVAEFITDYENKNENTLSIEEFSAISDLNKQLRF